MKFSEYLAESPLPDQWDKTLYKGRLDFKTMIEYATSRADTLGQGSSRVAFLVKHDGIESVIKIAKNPKGVSQNVQEIKYLSDKKMIALNILIPLLDYDKENHKARWVQTALASKIKDSFFEQESGLPLKELVLYTYRKTHGLEDSNTEKWATQINEKSEIVKNLSRLFFNNKDIEYGDLTRIDNWGLYNGSAVILDIGLDSTSIQTYRLKR